MDRRSFMVAGAGFAALGHTMPWVSSNENLDVPREHVLFLVDSALRATRALLAAWGIDGRDAIEVGADVGALWYARLRDWPGAIKGSLRPSDGFVLRSLSMGEGRSFRAMNVGPRAMAFIIGVGSPEY